MLNSLVSHINELTTCDKQQMYQLYASYYQGSNPDIFNADLYGKNYVIVLRDNELEIKGFSTLAVYDEIFQSKKVKVIFSGDTIVDKNYWGQNQLSKDWLEFAGHLKSQAPDTPLYWLLIVKGHRTYRYLSLFSKDYYPRYNRQTPDNIQQLMHYLARQRFASAYNPETGLIKFPEPRSYLKEAIALIPEKDRVKPEIDYFVQRNPRYFEGDELLCLCELKSENLSKMGSDWFDAGYAQTVACR